MDLEIFKLSKQANKRRLAEFLDEQPDEDIENVIKFKLNDYRGTNDVDTTLMLRAIIQGSPVETALQRRFLIARCVVNWLCNEENDAPGKSKQASAVVNLILPELELFATSMLSQISTIIIEAIKENKSIHLRSLDIFSKTWNLLVAADELSECANIFDDLLRAEWNHQVVVGIVSALNDMELSKNQTEAALKVLIKKMPTIEIEQIPPLVWQLLLISRKGFKKLVLSGILDFFNKDSDRDTRYEQIKEFLRELTHAENSSIEGTVMLHISFALKQDQELGNELIKIIKNNKSSQLELFNVACLLTAARIHRLQDTVFDLFKASIISMYRDTDKLDRCYWISEYSPLDADKYGQVLLDVTDKSATAGWDQVIQSLTQLAIILIDTGANAGSFFQPNATIKTRSNASKEDGPMEKVIQLGINILLRLFKYHDIVRTEILEQITSRIVSRSNSAIDFLKLLSTIIREYPESVEKYLSNIKDTLDILSFLPLPTADRLLNAIQPISKTNDQFRDGLILILRKSLFAKDLDGREMAVRGFLNTLNEQLTEIDDEQDPEQSLLAQGVAFEVLGLLRRCFSQQEQVRTCTYNGLGSLSMQHPSFAGDIFDLLYTQFMKSYEKNASITNPIKIDACIENASNGGYPKVNEPIHVLLANLIKSFRMASTQQVTSVTLETLDRFKANMVSFIDRLIKCNLEDFELDKTANFDMATHIGLRNNQFANLMIGVYEISIEYVYLNEGITVQSTEKILSLFKKRKSIIAVLKESSTNERGRKISQVHTQTYVSLKFTSKIFQAVFNNETPKEEFSACIRDLRSDIDFAHFIVSSTFDSLKYAIDDEYCRQDQDYLAEIVAICKTYIALLISEDSDSSYASHPSSKKSTSVLGSIASCILSTFEIVDRVWPDRFRDFLIAILAEDEDEYRNKSTNRIINEIITRLKEVVLKYLSGRTPIYKEASQVMHIVSFLCSKLDKKGADFAARSKHVIRWLDELAKDRPIEEISLARDMFALLIDLCANIAEFDTIQRVCEDVHLYMGDLEMPQDDTQMQITLTYQIINTKTITTIIGRMFEFLDSSFDDLTWCIGRLKICASESIEDKTRPFEKELCRRIIALMMILSELVKSVLTDAHAECLFKTLAKAYRTLHTLVKYKISYPQEVSTDFVDVISRCGTEVTDKMYKFLTVYGQSQAQEDPNARSKKKGKKREVDMKQKAKIIRETKVIPNLIFAVEQFERHLIQLSRKSRVDFMQYMKRSTSRDFRIYADKIMEPEEESSEEEEDSLKGTSEDGGAVSKRARIA